MNYSSYQGNRTGDPRFHKKNIFHRVSEVHTKVRFGALSPRKPFVRGPIETTGLIVSLWCGSAFRAQEGYPPRGGGTPPGWGRGPPGGGVPQGGPPHPQVPTSRSQKNDLRSVRIWKRFCRTLQTLLFDSNVAPKARGGAFQVRENNSHDCPGGGTPPGWGWGGGPPGGGPWKRSLEEREWLWGNQKIFFAKRL